MRRESQAVAAQSGAFDEAPRTRLQASLGCALAMIPHTPDNRALAADFEIS
jgi:hypothetical protein